MSQMFICPACNGDGYGRPRDDGGEVPNHTPMQPAELRAACETYLRENGWERRPRPLGGRRSWLRASYGFRSLGEALDVQWARDGIGGAT